jgi:hypothetical protein
MPLAIVKRLNATIISSVSLPIRSGYLREHADSSVVAMLFNRRPPDGLRSQHDLW